MTVLESLDTLFIMGLQAEFAQARAHVAAPAFFTTWTNVPVFTFENSIRALGSLLAAHGLVNSAAVDAGRPTREDPLWRRHAIDLGHRLVRAFCPSLTIY